jgi:hypothetical protein
MKLLIKRREKNLPFEEDSFIALYTSKWRHKQVCFTLAAERGNRVVYRKLHTVWGDFWWEEVGREKEIYMFFIDYMQFTIISFCFH